MTVPCGMQAQPATLETEFDERNPNVPRPFLVPDDHVVEPNKVIRVNTNDWFTCEPPNARGDGVR